MLLGPLFGELAYNLRMNCREIFTLRFPKLRAEDGFREGNGHGERYGEYSKIGE